MVTAPDELAPEDAGEEIVVDVGEDVGVPPPPDDDDEPDASTSETGQTAEAAAPEIPPAIVQFAVKWTTDYLAAARGAHWEATPAEVEAIAIPLAGELSSLAAFLGLGGLSGGVLSARQYELLAATAAYAVPRILEDVRLARSIEDTGQTAEAPAPPPPPEPPPTRLRGSEGGGGFAAALREQSGGTPMRGGQ